MFGLMDCNNFYASCERLFRPDLASKPVVVLSNNDGCIIARSEEAKALGISMAAPLFQVQSLLTQHNVAVFSSNFALYGEISGRVMDLADSLVPRLEVYSIDEAFIDFTGIINLAEAAINLRHQIAKCIGIPTCIGMGPTKTLAKIANHIAKKTVKDSHGICILKNKGVIDAALKELEVKETWGIGRQLTSRLLKDGIKTAYDLKKMDPRWMRQHFTVVGERIVHELNGIPALHLNLISRPVSPSKFQEAFQKN